MAMKRRRRTLRAYFAAGALREIGSESIAGRARTRREKPLRRRRFISCRVPLAGTSVLLLIRSHLDEVNPAVAL